MLNKFNISIVFVLLTSLLSSGALYAQKTDSLDLQLNHAAGRQRRPATVPDNGEFKLSLGSQLFNEPEITLPVTSDDGEITRIEIAETFSDIGSINIDRLKPAAPAQLTLRSSKLSEHQRFAPTITLSSAYEDNAIGLNDPAAESLSIRSESGRLRIYGELEQQRITPLAPKSTGGFGENGSQRTLRASVTAKENDGQQKLEPHEASAALASRYYLEAVYSFKPTLKGKVSFRRSMIDTFESEEKLQVEGIVEANQNIQIKAGYNNEVRPEVTDTKSSKDTKVWTEFILKF
ncbi:MAG: hypothetical protein CVV42_04060 [Candidatus Riflebacteria bacterium HGW-Riflebacteria-2]|jgi:hypothetical protein|nr:MAG: hypothetical protein CVV42_04060 [Candidatus Riflebacteria bacterium HGW-Riflebacteria-2]